MKVLNDHNCLALVGLQWGDEGKGKLVDWLATNSNHVVRFQGGHNAGHTVITEGKEYTLHLIPSGVLNPKCSCYIGQGVVLSLKALTEEIAGLEELGIDLTNRLFISPYCSLVLPHHQLLDQQRESGADEIGTTKRGIGPAHEDKSGRIAIKLIDVISDTYQSNLEKSINKANLNLVNKIDFAEDSNELFQLAKKVEPYLADVNQLLIAAKQKDEIILLEGSQGALLDLEQGTYPYVTSASCIASAHAAGIGVNLHPHVIGVVKAYTTRVGLGSFPTELTNDDANTLIKQGQEFGATTSRQRRVGWLDIVALKHALAINGCNEIAITKIDILGLVDKLKICVAYKYKGNEITNWPPHDAILSDCEPVYIEMPSWGQLANLSSYDDLPNECKSYITKIEELCEIKVSIISYGKDRKDTIFT